MNDQPVSSAKAMTAGDLKSPAPRSAIPTLTPGADAESTDRGAIRTTGAISQRESLGIEAKDGLRRSPTRCETLGVGGAAGRTS